MQVEFHYIFKLFKKKVYPLLSEKNNLIDKHQANEYIEDWSSNFFWINLSFFFFSQFGPPGVWFIWRNVFLFEAVEC